MLSKSSLLVGAAASALLIASAAQSQSADAPSAKPKPVHHRHVERKAVEHVDESPALVSEMASMREQLEALKAAQEAQAARDQAQMDEMRAQLAQAQSAAQSAQSQLAAQIQTIPGAVDKAVAAVAPKTDKIYYKGVTVTLGGFAAIESVYRSHNEAADIGSTYSGLPLPYVSSGASRTAEYRETARQSRISLMAEGLVTPDIKLTGYGEVDFLGAAVSANSNESNSYQPRVRNLYGEIDWKQPWGNIEFTGGQSWSLATLYNKGLSPRSEQVPLTIEAQYVPGFNWARQPQMRLTATLDNQLSFGVSVENPQTTFYTSGKYNSGVSLVDTIPAGSEFPGSGTTNTLSLNKLPDIIAKVALDESYEGHTLHAEAYGLYRDFYARVDTSGAYANEDQAGGGVGGGVIVGLIPAVLDLQASGLIGRGIGRYGSGQLPDVSFGLDGSIKPIHEWELLVGGVGHIGTRLDVYVYAGEEREFAQQYGVASSAYNGVGNLFLNNSGCEVDGGSCGNSTHYIDQITTGFWHRPYVGKFGKLQWGIQYSYTERHLFPGYGTISPTLPVSYDAAPIARESMIFTSIRYFPF
jgi:type II secretory pathway pseudopilin PulG